MSYEPSEPSFREDEQIVELNIPLFEGSFDAFGNHLLCNLSNMTTHIPVYLYILNSDAIDDEVREVEAGDDSILVNQIGSFITSSIIDLVGLAYKLGIPIQDFLYETIEEL